MAAAVLQAVASRLEREGRLGRACPGGRALVSARRWRRWRVAA